MPLAKLRLINKPGTKRNKKWPNYSKGESLKKDNSKKTSLKKISSKKISSKKNSPKKISSKKISSKETSLKKISSKKTSLKKNSPKKTSLKKISSKNDKLKSEIDKNTAKRSKTVAKRKKIATRSPNVKKSSATKRKNPKRVAAGKKAARVRAAKKAARVRAGKKAARTRAAKKTSSVRTRSKSRVKKSTTRTAKSTGRSLMLKPAPRSKKKRKYSVVRKTKKTRTGKYYYKYSIKNNPFSQMKSALIQGAGMFAGVLGMRVIGNVLKKNVFDKYATSIPASILPVLPSLSGFVASTLLIPRVMKNTKIVQSIQYGATYSLFESLFSTFIQDKLPDSIKEYTGIGGTFSVYEPVSEYVPGLGEYTHDNRLGNFNVNESMAGYDSISGDEYEYMQTGGAGGSLARTVFTE